MDGLLLFGKYAFAPNVLQYCGPENSKTFLEILKEYSKEKTGKKNKLAEEFKHLSLQFDGAVPYLKLIAGANGIKDFFDSKVVEAYWLGNNLLRNVSINNLYRHVEERFSKRMGVKDWHLIKNTVIINKAKPFHNFHVFSIYSHIGLMRSGTHGNILKTMDNCRINWGKVKEISNGNAIIEYSPLEFDNFGDLKLGEKTVKKFYFLDNSIKKGDEVSLHWDFICDKLTLQQKRNLAYWTNYHLKLFNELHK